MNIAFLTTEYPKAFPPSGGLGTYVQRITQALYQKGHNPVVFITSTRQNEFNDSGVEIYEIDCRAPFWLRLINLCLCVRFFSPFINYYYRSWKIIKSIRRIHTEKHFSIVHSTQLGAVSLFRLKKIPLVIRLSSYTPLWNLYGEFPHIPKYRLKQMIWLEKRCLKKADSVFGPCRFTAAYVKKDLQIPVSVIETPFIPLKEALDESLYKKHLIHKKFVLYFGRISKAKGIDILIEILYPLLHENPGMNFVFVFSDDIPYQGQNIRDILWKRSKEYREKIFIFYKIPHVQLYPIISNSQAVLLPSLVENFPNTCIESMAQKAIVAGTRHTSFEQLITDNISGFLAEPGSPSSLLKTAQKIIDLSSEKRVQIKEQAYERSKKLSPELIIPELIKYYSNVINQRSNHKE